MEKVVIIMATYNGEKYIKEQLESIINQTYSNWKLIIHDDNSTDKTMDILYEYKIKYKEKIEIIDDKIVFKSAKKNFMHLLNIVKNEEFEYALFCDQDDIWVNNKIEIMLDYARKENREIPIVIHSDSRLIDANDNVIGESFNESSKLHKERKDFLSIYLWNIAQGCSMMINKKCFDFIDINIEKIIMHDWWICIIASIFGSIVYINKQLIDYRQHDNNCIGGEKQKSIFDVIGVNKLETYKTETIRTYYLVYEQFKEIKKYFEHMPDSKKKIYNELLTVMGNGNMFNRIFLCIKERLVFKKGIKTCLGFVLFGKQK